GRPRSSVRRRSVDEPSPAVDRTVRAGDGTGAGRWMTGHDAGPPGWRRVLRPPCRTGLSRNKPPLTNRRRGSGPPDLPRLPHTRAARPPRSVGVDQLADRRDLAAKLVVAGRFAGDLVAGVEDRRVVPTAELRADPEERHVGLLAHEEHRDLARHDD